MNYAKIKKNSIGNWEGISVSLYCSGCPFHCKGCFQPETWNPKYGKEFTDEVKKEILEELEKPYYDNLVLLGGEPLAPYNLETMTNVAREFKEKFPYKQLVLFTGYLFEDVKKYEIVQCYVDIVIDGQYIEELYSPLLFFRGSSNQRVIDVKSTLKEGKIVLFCE